MNRNTLKNQEPDHRFQLECSLCEYSRSKLKQRLKEEGIPISSSALDSAAEIYSEKLIKTLEICMSNLIESDVSNIKDIFEKVRSEKSI